ncbi:MAG TPA: PIG-L family deacetylase [Terriglobia bacterium]|nr:PIG-L family deacetylase [Terriglobia bacterium]
MSFHRERGGRARARLSLFVLALGFVVGSTLAVPPNLHGGPASGLTPGSTAAPQAAQFQAVTDNITYDVGTVVKLRIAALPGHPEGAPRPDRVVALVRYEGDPTLAALAKKVLYTGVRPPSGYVDLWQVPTSASTGRYNVDLEELDPESGKVLATQAAAASFAVHRKLVRIDRIELDKAFYTSGDSVRATVVLSNLSGKPLHGLRVEFSDRYWPWIAGPAAQAAASIVPIATALDLPAGTASRVVRGPHVAVAPEVKQPSTHQYGVVVWDHARKQAYDIAFSRLVFVNPPGTSAPRPYPGQYIYPELSGVNLNSYRHFYPARQGGGIDFDHEHTLFTPGATATVSFRVGNPGPEPWHAVRVEARLLKADDSVIATQPVAQNLDLAPLAAAVAEKVDFQLPQEAGLYRALVRVTASSGEVLANNDLELAVNPLPQSVLIFCAHEDDEGSWHGLIRAAVENNVPIHFVYFTSGDAGACDRYYERSCGPEEALNFGYIRMQETRAVLANLGVPADDILFLGLPDGGSGEIWYRHPSARDPYLAPLLATDHSPYEGMAFPNLAYARDEVVEAAAKLIRRFSPEAIVTAHPPAEGHIDHIVCNFFAVEALQQLQARGAAPLNVKVLVDRIYNPKEHPATPYHYAEHTFYVSGEAAALGQEAGWFYQSQGGTNREAHPEDFIRLPRTSTYREVLDWSAHAGWNDKEPTPAPKP